MVDSVRFEAYIYLLTKLGAGFDPESRRGRTTTVKRVADGDPPSGPGLESSQGPPLLLPGGQGGRGVLHIRHHPLVKLHQVPDFGGHAKRHLTLT